MPTAFHICRQNPQHARNENEGKLEKTEPDATKIQPTEEDSGRVCKQKILLSYLMGNCSSAVDKEGERTP